MKLKMPMQKHIAYNEGYKYVPTNENDLSTSDFDLSVTLICKGYNLEIIDTEPNGKLIFIFKNTVGISETIDGYWSNKIIVSPLEFANARKNLKSRIFAIQKSMRK